MKSAQPNLKDPQHMLQCSFCTCRGSGNQQPFPLVRGFPCHACVLEWEPETLIKGIEIVIHRLYVLGVLGPL